MNRCPNCGACKECGHGGHQTYPWPYTRPWYTPPQPIWISTPTTWGQDSNSITPQTSGGTFGISTTSLGMFQ